MDRREPREYSMDQQYQIGDTIDHPCFGVGRVIANLRKGKMEVDFDRIGVRTLVQNYK